MPESRPGDTGRLGRPFFSLAARPARADLTHLENLIEMKRLLIGAVLGVVGMSTAHADYLGLLTGRTANPVDMPKISIDGGILTEGDIQNIGVRANYRVDDTLTAFFGIGLAEVGVADGIAFSGGAYKYLPEQRIIPSLDMALKATLGYAPLEGNSNFGSFSVDVDTLSLSAEALVSGKEPIAANGLNWYAHAGLAVLRVDASAFGASADDTNLEPVFGGGIVLPLGPGELFAGAEFLDEFFLGVGYRYGL